MMCSESRSDLVTIHVYDLAQFCSGTRVVEKGTLPVTGFPQITIDLH